MFKRISSLYQDERGLSALETSIVLIAFVVVAAVFAFTMLSAGMFSTERSKEAVYAGLEEVQGSLELRGSMVLTTTSEYSGTTDAAVDTVIFTVGNVAGGSAVDMTDTSDTISNTLVIGYRDAGQRNNELEWDLVWLVQHDEDNLLEEGELAQITIPNLKTATQQLTTDLSVDTDFVIEVKPPQGGVLVLERRTPSYIDMVMDLQ